MGRPWWRDRESLCHGASYVRLDEVLRGLRANQRRGMCSDGVDGLGPGVHPAVTRRDTRAPVGRKRTNESANEKSHTLRSDGALLRKRCREYDDERFLILRVLSRELKEVGGEQNEHSTPQKPQRAPQFSPTREKKCTGLDVVHIRATRQPRSLHHLHLGARTGRQLNN